MQEIIGNLWDYYNHSHVIAVTTNGFVKNSGECTMGRGCAREARDTFPGIAKRLGSLIKEHGNHVHYLGSGIVSFPVKHNWWENADPALIERSARELVGLADTNDWKSIIIPRPGCGNGRLKWSDVKPILEKYLDNRFSVITKK